MMEMEARVAILVTIFVACMVAVIVFAIKNRRGSNFTPKKKDPKTFIRRKKNKLARKARRRNRR